MTVLVRAKLIPARLSEREQELHKLTRFFFVQLVSLGTKEGRASMHGILHRRTPVQPFSGLDIDFHSRGHHNGTSRRLVLPQPRTEKRDDTLGVTVHQADADLSRSRQVLFLRRRR